MSESDHHSTPLPSAILECVAFVEQGLASARLQACENVIGTVELRSCLIHLVSWLAGKAKMSKPIRNGMRMPSQYPWTQQLAALIDDFDDLRELFHVSNFELRFRNEVSAEQQQVITSYVAENYHPQLMTER
jgi:hypothetical protein